MFDGHGGALASETARRRFGEHFRRLHPARDSAAPDRWTEVFRATEESYRSESRGVPDSAGSKRGEGREGSTACAAYVSPSRLMSVANAGDSRCVVCLKNGQAKAMVRQRFCHFFFFFFFFAHFCFVFLLVC